MTKIELPVYDSTYMSISFERAEACGFKVAEYYYKYVSAETGLEWINSLAELYEDLRLKYGEDTYPPFDGYDLTAYYNYMLQTEYEYYDGKLPFPVAKHALDRIPPIEELAKQPGYYWANVSSNYGDALINTGESDDAFAARMVTESFNR